MDMSAEIKTVTLDTQGVTYHVAKFHGKEALNKPFWFEVSFNASEPVSLLNGMGETATLTVPCETPTPRQWTGVIESIKRIKIDRFTQHVTLTIHHPLFQLTFNEDEKQFYHQDELSLAVDFLKKHHIDFEIKGLPHDAFEPQPLLHQLQGQSDLDFVNQLLARIGVMYWIKPNNQVSLFTHLECLPNSEIDCLHYLPGQKNWVQGVPHFHRFSLKTAPTIGPIQGMTDNVLCPERSIHEGYHATKKTASSLQSATYQAREIAGDHHELTVPLAHLKKHWQRTPFMIESGMSHLRAGEHLCVNIADSNALSGWYVIEQVMHNYLLDEKTLIDPNHRRTTPGYQNHVSLYVKDAVSTQALKNHQATHSAKGNVVGNANSARLNEFGGYQYTLQSLPNTTSSLSRDSYQPYVPRLTPLAGTDKKGLHFPLQHHDEVVIAYINGAPEKPMILANLCQPYQNGRTGYQYKEQSVIASSNDLSFRMDDSIDNAFIQLSAGQNVWLLSLEKDNHHILVHSAGNLSIQAEKNIFFTAKNSELTASKIANIQTKKNISTHVDDAYYEKTQQQTSLKAHTYEAQSERRWQLNAEKIKWTVKTKCHLNAESGHIKLASNQSINITTRTLALQSKNSITLGTQQSYLQTKGDTINLKARQLTSSDNDNVAYFGRVNQMSNEKGLKKNPPSLQETSIKHKNISLTLDSSINDLSWHNCAPNISKPAIATFNIQGYAKGDRGHVIIYQCSTKDAATINPSPQFEKSKHETYQEIARIKFKVGDKALYDVTHDHHTKPGDAWINVPWHPKQLPKTQHNVITFYRFAVELKAECEPDYSKAMQWFTNVEITHKGKANVHTITLKRQQLPGICLYDEGERDEKATYTILPSDTTHALHQEKTLIKNVPLNSNNTLFLLSESGETKEVISHDYASVGPFHTLNLSTQKEIETRNIYSIKEPVIINLSGVRFDEKTNEPFVKFVNDENDRLLLTDHELNYFKENGNNVTIFIHGFNVPYGEFGHYQKNMRLDYELKQKPIFLDPINTMHVSNPYDDLKAILIHENKKQKNTVKINVDRFLNNLDAPLKPAQLKKLNLYDEASESLNGSGMHGWVTDFEKNLNQAAGFKDDYREFSRALFIAWPGEPKSPADYMAANVMSKAMGRAFAEVIIQLRKFSKDLEINVIAHSQGNGVMLSAFDYLGEHKLGMRVNHAFAWQAALPYTALNGLPEMRGLDPAYYSQQMKRQIKHERDSHPWSLPYAHCASKKFIILHSKNDNIVGAVIEKEEQPKGVNEQDVFERKPLPEYLAGVFTTYLGLGSLYEAANQLNIPASHLLDEKNLDQMWAAWVKSRPHTQIYLIDEKGKFIKYSKLETDLNTQINVLSKEKVLHDFCHTISKRIKKNKDKVNEKLSWLKNNDYYIGKAALSLLKHLGALEDEFISKYIPKDKKDLTLGERLIDNLPNDNGIVIVAELVKKHLFNSKIKPHLPWLVKMITFVYCTEIATNQKPINGMGWFGADLNNSAVRELFRENSLMNINCTEWVWQHSDMKVPSKDIMEEIYKKRIMYYIHYGKYENTGQGYK